MITSKQKKNVTLDEYLNTTWGERGKFHFSVIGDSLTAGVGASDVSKVWGSLLDNYFKGICPSATHSNISQGGWTTQNLIDNNYPDEVIADNPDLIIFEVTAFNDADPVKNPGGVELTKSNIELIMNRFINELPNCRTIITSPYTSTNPNSRMFPYMQDLRDYIHTKDWEYYDIWHWLETLLNVDGFTLAGSVSGDGVHPNDIGYYYWYRALQKLLNE